MASEERKDGAKMVDESLMITHHGPKEYPKGRDEYEGLKIAPGKVLLREISVDQMHATMREMLIPARAMEEHAGKKGSNFPFAEVLAVGPHLRGTADLNAMEDVLIGFITKGDRVWYDYRGCGQVYWRGEELVVAPRQYIILKVVA